MFVKGVGNLVRVTDIGVIYFHSLYYLVVLTTRHELINSLPSSLGVSFVSKTTVVMPYLSSLYH